MTPQSYNLDIYILVTQDTHGQITKVLKVCGDVGGTSLWKSRHNALV